MKRLYGIKWIAALAIVAALGTKASAETVTLFDGHQLAAILTGDDRPLQLAGDLLARDLEGVTGMAPQRASNKADCSTVCIVIGRYDSPLIRSITEDAGIEIDTAALKGQWERYERILVASKRDPQQRYLILAGSDTRGAIWGVMDLSRALGVSPWQWWADVPPHKRDHIAVDGAMLLSDVPSVRYRGIFLNDEDWGLQPWAAKTYEPETGDIGPKTYARIFELLWRLKANLIWPAMHDSTRPFYQVRG
ncbi:MAG: glycosyl hydrolase 115 family protein, partial [Rhizomicrobium sp.]